ncbi:hypothetical protein BDV18DRAFT_141602 [Aspergillus unguis]
MSSDDEPFHPGIPNDELFRLIRRFDKQVSHVQSVPRSQVRQHKLDLNRSADEQFPASKLQKTIERFYVSVVVKIGVFVSHVNHLRSWREPRRTGAYFGVYLLAWLLDVIIPLISGVLVAMIFFPSVREKLFPPIPEAELQESKPDADTDEDKPEIHAPPTNEGEAEHEAEDFVNGLTTSITEGITEPIGSEIPDPEPAGTGAGAVTATGTLTITAGDEKQKKKTSPAISITLKILSDITDLCERFANLLSPSPPFRLVSPRLQLAGILVSVFLVSLLLSSHMIVKTVSLTTGLAFFGDPVLSRAMKLLNEKVPNWKEYLDIEKTLLKGVPTNAQLTLSLLRIAELNATPLPVPPLLGSSSTEDTDTLGSLIRRKSSKPSTLESSAESAQDTSSTTGTTEEDPNLTTKAKTKSKKWLRILRFAKRAITTAIKGHVAFNGAMALAGAGSKYHARTLLSAVLDRNLSLLIPPASMSSGPFTFEAKFERKRGTAVIDSVTDPENPVLYFTSKNAGKVAMKEDLRVGSQKEENVGFKVSIKEISELRKTEGLGWKGKLIVQLAAGGEGSTEGLVVGVDEPENGNRNGEGEGEEKKERKRFHLTGMRGRNQLFNRLVASGVQCWEMY